MGRYVYNGAMGYLKKHEKTVILLAGAMIQLLAFAVVLFYLYKRCRSEFNADYTDTILWAETAVRSGHFYNPEYWYAYFLPFSGIPLMIPIVKAFGLTYFAHQLGMTVFAVIFAASLILFMRTMECSYGEAFAFSGITMILMCASSVTRMIFYGHVIHYSLVIVFMCIAFFFLTRSSVFVPDSKHSLTFDIILAIWCMLCVTNGMATFILFFVPFAGCLVIERFLDRTPISYEHDKALFGRIAIYTAGGIAGYIIKMFVFPSSEYENSITALLPSDGWVWKQSPFLLEWIKVLTDDSSADVLMQSFDGIKILCMYVLALVLLLLPVVAVFSYRKIKSRLLRLLIIFHWLMFATTMLTYSVSYALVSNWRLCHLICSSVILSLLYIRYMLKEKLKVRWFIFFVPFLALCCLIAMLAVKSIPSAVNANETDQLIEIYRENGLTRGYASSFWNSTNSANVLSDNTICVAPITINTDGSYEVRHYQSEPSEYEDVPGVDRYFVVVDSTDMAYAADTLGANKVEEIKFQDNLYIWVFDRNIFSGLEPVF